MTAGSARPDGKLVWIPNAFWADLAEALERSDHPGRKSLHAAILAARDAAPADPAEAVSVAHAKLYGDLSADHRDIQTVTRAVLRALGVPHE